MYCLPHGLSSRPGRFVELIGRTSRNPRFAGYLWSSRVPRYDPNSGLVVAGDTVFGMINNSDYRRLLKLMEMFSSPNDHEALAAMNAASKILSGVGLTWSEIVLPRQLMPTRADPTEALAVDVEQEERVNPPLGEATVEQMVRAVLESSNVDPNYKRDVYDYARIIKTGHLSAKQRADLQAMYNYGVLQGRKL